MQQHIPLKRFKYCISDPDAAATGKNIHDQHSIEMCTRLTTIDIDFEKGSLSFEGEGIKVKAAVYPGFDVDLSDRRNDLVVFSLKGILEDGKTINSCSGLLVLQRMAAGKCPESTEWRITAFVNDDYNDEREIKFDLTMLSISGNAELN
jgi:hypothetical protein